MNKLVRHFPVHSSIAVIFSNTITASNSYDKVIIHIGAATVNQANDIVEQLSQQVAQYNTETALIKAHLEIIHGSYPKVIFTVTRINQLRYFQTNSNSEPQTSAQKE